MSKFTRYPTYYEQKEAIARSKWGNFTHFEHLISDNLFYHTFHVANCLHFSLSVCFTLHLNKYRLFQKVDFVDVSAVRSMKFMKSTSTHSIQQMYIYFDQPIFRVGGGEAASRLCIEEWFNETLNLSISRYIYSKHPHIFDLQITVKSSRGGATSGQSFHCVEHQ